MVYSLTNQLIFSLTFCIFFLFVSKKHSLQLVFFLSGMQRDDFPLGVVFPVAQCIKAIESLWLIYSGFDWLKDLVPMLSSENRVMIL